MASRRDQIRMSDDEVRAFLAEQKVMTVGTIGPQRPPPPDGALVRARTASA